MNEKFVPAKPDTNEPEGTRGVEVVTRQAIELVENLVGQQELKGDQPFEVQMVDNENKNAYLIQIRRQTKWITVQQRVSDNPLIVETFLFEKEEGNWKYVDPYEIKYGESSLPNLIKVVNRLRKVWEMSKPDEITPGRAELDDLLTLTPEEFDQDEEKGWRKLEKTGHALEAAQAIKTYLLVNKDKLHDGSPDNLELESLMHFHVGQLIASHDDRYTEAIESFERASMPGNERWNLYILATIDFLKNDLVALNEHLKQLKQVEDPQKRNLSQVVMQLANYLKKGKNSYNKAYNEL